MIDGMLLAAALSVCSRHTMTTTIPNVVTFQRKYDEGFESCSMLDKMLAEHFSKVESDEQQRQDIYDRAIIDRALKEMGK